MFGRTDHLHKATLRGTAERDYECERCGARAVVALEAIGRGGWQGERQHGSEIAAVGRSREDAESDMRRDVGRMLRMMKCPTCGRRAPRAIGSAIARVAFWLVGGAGLAMLFRVADGPVTGTYVAIAFAIGLGFQVWSELWRLRRAARVTILRLTPGTPPATPAAKPDRPPPARLPEARAITAPPIVVEPAPPAPQASAPQASAPPPPLAPGAEPQFLTKRDD